MICVKDAREHRHQTLLREQLDNYVGEEMRRRILPEGECIYSTSTSKQKAGWAKAVIDRMDQLISDDEMRKRIRHGCACGISRKQEDLVRRAKVKHANLDDYLAELSSTGLHGKMQREGNTLQVAFNLGRCVCSVVSGATEPLSRTFCECCNGHVKMMWGKMLGMPVRSEMLETHRSGGQECRFVVHFAADQWTGK